MPNLVIGPYQIDLTLNHSCDIKSEPQNHQDYGLIPGTIRFSVNYKICGERRTRVNPGLNPHYPVLWADKQKWQMGFYQIVHSIDRTVYAYKTDVRHKQVQSTGDKILKMAHLKREEYEKVFSYLKEDVSITTPCRDAVGGSTDTKKPWYDSKNETSTAFSNITELRMGTRKMGDAPGVKLYDSSICGIKQSNARFSTYFVLMEDTRQFGLTLYQWDWTADFVYFKNPETNLETTRGGIELTSFKDFSPAFPKFNRTGLPDGSPADDPVGKDILIKFQQESTRSQVTNIREELGI